MMKWITEHLAVLVVAIFVIPIAWAFAADVYEDIDSLSNQASDSRHLSYEARDKKQELEKRVQLLEERPHPDWERITRIIEAANGPVTISCDGVDIVVGGNLPKLTVDED